MSAPLISWKRQPPDAPEEAATARLLEAVGEPPALTREAAARIRSRVHGGKKGHGPRGRQRQLFPIFGEPRISLLAAGLALLAILAALIVLLLGEQPTAKAPSGPRVESSQPKPAGVPPH
jgi:hypothetical protein